MNPRYPRYLEAKELLENREFFKLICGAGNQQLDEVYKLSYIYTRAGAKGIDVWASPRAIDSALFGITEAYEDAEELGIDLGPRPFIIVSVGIAGDAHIRKAFILENRCNSCGLCSKTCPQLAISIPPFVFIDPSKCIGCGKCANTCPNEAISFFTEKKLLKDLLEECYLAGAEQAELHASVPASVPILSEWKILDEIFSHNFVSICLDRSFLNNSQLIERVTEVQQVSRDRLIVQADGIPMSGSSGINSTLQSVATADTILKSIKKKPYILLSGGTNDYTGYLARLCSVGVNGISIGSFARNLVKDALDQFNNKPVRNKGVELAQDLILKNFPREL